MNLKKFKSRLIRIDKIIPRNKWFEIPIENKYWAFFGYQGLYAFFKNNKIIYIGVSSDINLRLKAHISCIGKFKEQKKFSKIKIKISLLDRASLEQIENRLILRLKPKYNNQIISEKKGRTRKKNRNKTYKYKKTCRLPTCQKVFKTNFKRQNFCEDFHRINYHEIKKRRGRYLFELEEKETR